MGAQRFAVEGFNEIMPLTETGAKMDGMGLKAFEPMKPEVSLPKPSVSISAPGGMA